MSVIVNGARTGFACRHAGPESSGPPLQDRVACPDNKHVACQIGQNSN